MARLCVFCGSSPGLRPSYLDAARRLGRTLAEGGHGVVYGGSSIGLMGAVADAALERGRRSDRRHPALDGGPRESPTPA